MSRNLFQSPTVKMSANNNAQNTANLAGAHYVQPVPSNLNHHGAPGGPLQRPTMDLTLERSERLETALSILSNYQLLLKFATDNKQVSP